LLPDDRDKEEMFTAQAQKHSTIHYKDTDFCCTQAKWVYPTMLPNDMQKKKSDSEPENDQYTILYIYM